MTEPREIHVVLTDGVSIADHASLVKKRGDEVVGYAESERDGLLTRADQLNSGYVCGHISGNPPQGEKDTLAAAQILVTALNAAGATWGPVVLSCDPADCETVCTANPTRRLLIQVVRATIDADYWRRLAADGAATRTESVEFLAAHLNEAIRHKTRKYPSSTRANLVLALDASRLPDLALSRVRGVAAESTREARAAAGFSDVWVVGPTPELTYRLSD